MRSHRHRLTSFLGASTLAVTLAACGGAGATSEGSSAEGGSNFPQESINFMAPAAPGGGWDTTARVVAKKLQETGISPVSVEVFNVAGASGTVGLAQLANQHSGDPYHISITGLTMMGAIHTLDSPVTFDDVTPIARLITEYSVIVVRAKSPIKNIDDLVARWKSEKAGMSWAGGGKGGPDHQLVGKLGKEAGLSPSQINYVVFEGGGATLPQLLGGRIDAASIGLSEILGTIQAGQVRALAVSSEERLEALPDVPTLKESGYDATMANWRGIIAPPGISDSARSWYIEAITELTKTPEWKEAVDKYDWNPYLMTGDEFGQYLKTESAAVKQNLADLGLM